MTATTTPPPARTAAQRPAQFVNQPGPVNQAATAIEAPPARTAREIAEDGLQQIALRLWPNVGASPDSAIMQWGLPILARVIEAALLAAASSQQEELDRVRGERDQWQHNSYENAREVGRLRSELAAITGANAKSSLARARADAIEDAAKVADQMLTYDYPMSDSPDELKSLLAPILSEAFRGVGVILAREIRALALSSRPVDAWTTETDRLRYIINDLLNVVVDDYSVVDIADPAVDAAIAEALERAPPSPRPPATGEVTR